MSKLDTNGNPFGNWDSRNPDYRPLDNNEIDSNTLSHIFTPIDLEDLFRRSPGAKIVNNENLTAMSLSQEFCDAICQHSDGEIGFVPMCACEKLRGGFYNGWTCPDCNTIVSTAFVDKLTHTAWLGVPHELPPMIHPVWYFILKNWSGGTKSNASIIDAILDVDRDVPENLKPIIKEQGFRYFYDHADEIFEYLFTQYPWTAAGKKSTAWVKLFYEKYRSVLFTTKLPILHSSLHPLMKSSGTLKFADKSSKDIMEAVFNLSTVSFMNKNTTTTPKSVNRTLYGIFGKVMSYYLTLIKEKIGDKYGIIRHHNLESGLL